MTCRQCGFKRGHHRRCSLRNRPCQPDAKRVLQPCDDEWLVIVALRMAARTGREDLRPHYERLAHEREAIRKSQVEDITK